MSDSEWIKNRAKLDAVLNARRKDLRKDLMSPVMLVPGAFGNLADSAYAKHDPQFNIDRLRLRVKRIDLEKEEAQIDLQEAMFRAGQIGPKYTVEKDDDAVREDEPATPSSDKGEVEGLLGNQPEPVATEVRNQAEQDAAKVDDDWEDGCDDLNCTTCYGPTETMSDFSRGAQDAIDGDPRKDDESEEYYHGFDATTESVEGSPQLPEGFLPWSGGECPVEEGTRVNVIRRDGLQTSNYMLNRTAAFMDWTHVGKHPLDIIAYRVVQAENRDVADASRIIKASEPPSELDSSSEVGGDREEQIHNREKLSEEEFSALPKLGNEDAGLFDGQPEAELPGAASDQRAPQQPIL
ncbi:MAG: hypothetical protein ACRDL7_09925, partial [Gaiellaceae bacterium]